MNTPSQSKPSNDDILTICAISVLAFIIADTLHEAVGHALLALLTGTQTGLLTTVAWSSAYDSRLVAAGGTLVNLAAGLSFWIGLRSARNASVHPRLFMLLSCAFNFFTGTGYFFFSGVTDFGDWAVVIAGLTPHWLWRTLLIVVGMATYYAVALMVGRSTVVDLGIPSNDRPRLRRVLLLPYFSAIVISVAGGLFNPIGIQLMWQSALPATAGANSGLLWLQHYIPGNVVSERTSPPIKRSVAWIGVAAVLAAIFVFVLGRGITLHR